MDLRYPDYNFKHNFEENTIIDKVDQLLIRIDYENLIDFDEKTGRCYNPDEYVPESEDIAKFLIESDSYELFNIGVIYVWSKYFSQSYSYVEGTEIVKDVLFHRDYINDERIKSHIVELSKALWELKKDCPINEPNT